MSLIEKSREKSPWIYHLNTGSCNGCDIELLALLGPRYDVERFGVKFVGSPRHADIIVVTGPVTVQSKGIITSSRSKGSCCNRVMPSIRQCI